MSSLRNQLIDEHIENHYPNAKMVTHQDQESGLIYYTADQLKWLDADWFPLACYVDEKTGKTVYGGRSKVVHTYTEGETGAGKTTRFVMQSIQALSSMKCKPSFLIVDIHGEIIENLYGHLKNNGYDVRILNCDNPERSDTYNPFYEMAEDCLQAGCITNDTVNGIRRIADIIQPVNSRSDPIWDMGARAYTNGCILDKFEDLVEGKLSKEYLTLYNIIKHHYWLREKITSCYGLAELRKIPHYKNKPEGALSVEKMVAVTDNAEKTRASYFGVVENHYDIFGQPTLYRLSSSSTINISDFINKPTAIVIQSGSTQIGDHLISLLVNDIYTKVVKIGRQSETKRLPRNIHCFLDEFANCNIADGPEYIKMLTTSRKFGMYWHMILQCDAQLDRKFDPSIGKIIRSNSTEIFMGSHDYETEVRFARSCGQRTIESLASRFSQNYPQLEVVELLTPDALNLIEEGYAYVKTNRQHLLKTYIEAFYNCRDFSESKDLDCIYPHNDFDYTKTLLYPDSKEIAREKAEKMLTENPFSFLEETPKATTAKSSKPSASDKENQELKKCLRKHKQEAVQNVFAKLTCIPDMLNDLVQNYYQTKTCEDPINLKILKFEIIEEFIKNHDFATKAEWDDKFKEEYEILKNAKIFPGAIMKEFQNAVLELCNELTFSNIKEIKRILSGT